MTLCGKKQSATLNLRNYTAYALKIYEATSWIRQAAKEVRVKSEGASGRGQEIGFKPERAATTLARPK